MGNRNNRQVGSGGLSERAVVKVNLLQPPEDFPISIDAVRKGAQGICTLSQPTGTAKGVMITWEGLHGIITYASSKSLTSCVIQVELRPFGKPEKVHLDTTKLITLYCPLAEVIFIKLEPEIVKQIIDYGCGFVEIPKSCERAADNARVFLCNSLIDKNNVNISCGELKEHYGLDIAHTATCHPDTNAGLPVFSERGELLGIQKCIRSSSAEPTQPPTTLAVSMSMLISIHFPFIAAQVQHNKLIITNPVDMSAEDAKLREIGLEKCIIPKQKYAECNFYVSPPEKYITPIWFMPTCLGWYWTPTDPNDDKLDSNWMPVTVLAVVGGSWRGQIPAAKNCTIIRSLKKKEDNQN